VVQPKMTCLGQHSPLTNVVTYFLFIDTHRTDTLGWTGSLSQKSKWVTIPCNDMI
jgi:hypothetical protein